MLPIVLSMAISAFQRCIATLAFLQLAVFLMVVIVVGCEITSIVHSIL